MENLEKYSETPQQLFEKAQQAVADNNRYQAATLFLDAAVKGHCEAQYRVAIAITTVLALRKTMKKP